MSQIEKLRQQITGYRYGKEGYGITNLASDAGMTSKELIALSNFLTQSEYDELTNNPHIFKK